MQSRELVVQSADGHKAALIARIPDAPRASLLWLPALGVAARNYIPLAEALAAGGIAVYLHEWRGNGSSSVRAGRGIDWGYRELLDDIDASSAISNIHSDGMPCLAGGHSLGGQLACMHAALAPGSIRAVWLVASGAPFWRAFPRPMRWWLPPAARFLQWLAQRRGFLPGRRIGFAGNEATGVMTDWARTALSGCYAGFGTGRDIEQALSTFNGEVRALTLAKDWMAPPSSLKFLLSKLAKAHITETQLSDAQVGVRADHFTWMKHPDAIAAWLTGSTATKPI